MSAVDLAIIVNSALYLAGCIAAGLATGNRAAWALAITDAGVLYLGYLLRLEAPTVFSRVAWLWLACTIAFGVAAGLALLL